MLHILALVTADGTISWLRVATLQPVEKPIHFGGPGTAIRLVELPLEIVESVALLLAVHFQRVADVADVVEGLEFGDAARQHHCQKGDENVCVLPEAEVCLATQLHKPVTTCKGSHILNRSVGTTVGQELVKGNGNRSPVNSAWLSGNTLVLINATALCRAWLSNQIKSIDLLGRRTTTALGRQTLNRDKNVTY